MGNQTFFKSTGNLSLSNYQIVELSNYQIAKLSKLSQW